MSKEERVEINIHEYGILNRAVDNYVEMVWSHAHDTQKEDIKKVFLSGALLMFETMTTISSEAPEMVAHEFLDNVSKELKAFKDENGVIDVETTESPRTAH